MDIRLVRGDVRIHPSNNDKLLGYYTVLNYYSNYLRDTKVLDKLCTALWKGKSLLHNNIKELSVIQGSVQAMESDTIYTIFVSRNGLYSLALIESVNDFSLAMYELETSIKSLYRVSIQVMNSLITPPRNSYEEFNMLEFKDANVNTILVESDTDSDTGDVTTEYEDLPQEGDWWL